VNGCSLIFFIRSSIPFSSWRSFPFTTDFRVVVQQDVGDRPVILHKHVPSLPKNALLDCCTFSVVDGGLPVQNSQPARPRMESR